MTPVMRSLVAAVGALWIAVIMWDAFEAIVLPRRVTRRLRPARMFYRVTWRGGGAGARPMPPGGRRGGMGEHTAGIPAPAYFVFPLLLSKKKNSKTKVTTNRTHSSTH